MAGAMPELLPQTLPHWALLSDAMRLTLVGAGCWLVAALAAVMEWRRSRGRSIERLERVGWMPWTAIFLGAAFIGGGCLAMGLPVLLTEV
jgi:hypothetical protein